MTFNSARGYYIRIDHGNNLETVYQHCSGFAAGLSVGSSVSQGQIIAYVGSTGDSTETTYTLKYWFQGVQGEPH